MPLSDYGSGTNHVLPTGGFAQAFSGLSAVDFMRRVSIVESSREGLEKAKDSIKVLTDTENLPNHYKAIECAVRKMSASYRAWIKQKISKLQAIDCYSAGVTPEGLAKQIGVEVSDVVKLNFNENLFVDRAKQTALMKELAEEIDLRMYPEDEVPKLQEKIAGYMGVPRDFVAVGNAGDEINRPHNTPLHRER